MPKFNPKSNSNPSPIYRLLRDHQLTATDFCVAADIGHSTFFYLARGVQKKLPTGVRNFIRIKGAEPVAFEEAYRKFREEERQRLLAAEAKTPSRSDSNFK
jgi:predicted transcriptional regulator